MKKSSKDSAGPPLHVIDHGIPKHYGICINWARGSIGRTHHLGQGGASA